MINENICFRKNVRGAELAESRFGLSGHAVWGPYEQLKPGDYRVIFRIRPIDLGQCEGAAVVASLDVSLDFARTISASKSISAGDLRRGESTFILEFHLDSQAVVEYRVGVHGNARLEIEAYCPAARAEEDEKILSFPTVTIDSPQMLRHHADRFRQLFEKGFSVEASGNDAIVSNDGIRFFAREYDDLNLVEEIFIDKVYTFRRKRATVVIDVGMNIGLVSMQFSKNRAVERIYSFDPFKSTFDRAMANLTLNPHLAAKIVPSNTGVSDSEGIKILNVYDTNDSGSRSTRNDQSGASVPIQLELQKASDVVRKVRKAHPDSDIIMKIDCEGDEFAIFEDLTESGAIFEVTAFMVEWHTVFPGKSQEDIIAPLEDAGFTVIDRSPRTGNGFFYAVR